MQSIAVEFLFQNHDEIDAQLPTPVFFGIRRVEPAFGPQPAAQLTQILVLLQRQMPRVDRLFQTFRDIGCQPGPHLSAKRLLLRGIGDFKVHTADLLCPRVSAVAAIIATSWGGNPVLTCRFSCYESAASALRPTPVWGRAGRSGCVRARSGKCLAMICARRPWSGCRVYCGNDS